MGEKPEGLRSAGDRAAAGHPLQAPPLASDLCGRATGAGGLCNARRAPRPARRAGGWQAPPLASGAPLPRGPPPPVAAAGGQQRGQERGGGAVLLLACGGWEGATAAAGRRCALRPPRPAPLEVARASPVPNAFSNAIKSVQSCFQSDSLHNMQNRPKYAKQYAEYVTKYAEYAKQYAEYVTKYEVYE